jgi:hypothetical protein
MHRLWHSKSPYSKAENDILPEFSVNLPRRTESDLGIQLKEMREQKLQRKLTEKPRCILKRAGQVPPLKPEAEEVPVPSTS